MAFGVDPVTGFNLKRFSDIRDSLQALLIQIEDPDTGESLQIDFNEDDPLINILNSFIDELAQAWEVLQTCYDQFHPANAEGASLSGLVQNNGITRKTGSPSQIVVTVNGTNGTLVPTGFQVSTQSADILWETIADETIPLAETIDITFYSVDNGSFDADPFTIDNIVTSVSGITSVLNNDSATVKGTDDENDLLLRVRRSYSTETPARTTVEALSGAVANVTGVTSSRVFVNRTLSIDSRDLPPKSVAVVVTGGDDTEIANAIFPRVSEATQTYGNVTINIPDNLGEVIPISFVRPTQVDIEVEVDVEVIDSGLYEVSGGDDAIKDAIVAYAEGGASALGINTTESGFDEFGFTAGESVVQTRLFTPVNSITGHIARDIRIGLLGGSLGSSDIPIAWNEISDFDTVNITITQV